MSKTVEEMIAAIEEVLEKTFRMEGVRTTRNSLYNIISDYKRLLDIIKSNTDKSGICMLKKTEIAKLYGLSYTGTYKKLKFLFRYRILKECNPGMKVSGKCIISDTPISLTVKVLKLLKQHPELSDSYKKQAEALNIPIYDVRVAWGFISHC